MDEKDFKKHLKDLVHGHHHPEEHDWAPDEAKTTAPAKPSRSGPAKSTAKRRAKPRSK